MGKILAFKNPRIRLKDKARTRAKTHTMCKSGFHKWRIVTEQKFDVKEG